MVVAGVVHAAEKEGELAGTPPERPRPAQGATVSPWRAGYPGWSGES